MLLEEIDRILPFLPTCHDFHCTDALLEDFWPNNGVHLILTSPPYWNLKEYDYVDGQLGSICDYDLFLDQLAQVWGNCYDSLVPGGRLVCIVGDVCLSRKNNGGRHKVIPLHGAIQQQCEVLGFDNLAPIIWYKISNITCESRGSFLGKPYEPNAIIKNEIEYILQFRKPGYRSATWLQRKYSVIGETRHHEWFRQIWSGINGASTKNHPAPFPLTLAERLIRMFSFVGDTVFDPFLGSGTTSIAAQHTGRNSIGLEISRKYIDSAMKRFLEETFLFQTLS